MPNLRLPKRTILLDGGLGRELRFRGVDVMTSIWSAKALIDAPRVVREVHGDFIAAAATRTGKPPRSRRRNRTCRRRNPCTWFALRGCP